MQLFAPSFQLSQSPLSSCLAGLSPAFNHTQSPRDAECFTLRPTHQSLLISSTRAGPRWTDFTTCKSQQHSSRFLPGPDCELGMLLSTTPRGLLDCMTGRTDDALITGNTHPALFRVPAASQPSPVLGMRVLLAPPTDCLECSRPIDQSRRIAQSLSNFLQIDYTSRRWTMHTSTDNRASQNARRIDVIMCETKLLILSVLLLGSSVVGIEVSRFETGRSQAEADSGLP